uniref:hypothetical protein n=1 Tax=Klebsiella pneumoniae TaxID=573 RepID=UPI001880EBAF|nr:hypothetical protein [Klebsiella pneumoniae]
MLMMTTTVERNLFRFSGAPQQRTGSGKLRQGTICSVISWLTKTTDYPSYVVTEVAEHASLNLEVTIIQRQILQLDELLSMRITIFIGGVTYHELQDAMMQFCRMNPTKI